MTFVGVIVGLVPGLQLGPDYLIIYGGQVFRKLDLVMAQP